MSRAFKCIRFNIYTNSHRHFSQYSPLKTSRKMQTAFVYMNEGEDRLRLNFPYTDAVINKKQLTFQRPIDEPLETTFGRILLKITGFHEKKDKKKKKKTSEAAEGTKLISLPMKIVCESLEIPSDAVNSVAWKSNSIFIIGVNKYKINVNPPTVMSIKLPSEIMAGFPVIPCVQLQNASVENSSFVWYKSETVVEDTGRTSKNGKHSKVDYSYVKWTPITTGYTYNVRNDDIGHLLRVVCYPKLKEEEAECVHGEAVGRNPVGAGPDLCPYHIRHGFTKEKCGDKSFRVLSYNVLANCYADSDYSREHLFSYCPPYALAWDYRRQLLLDEIRGYNSDILCMQEVDAKAFSHDFQYFFKSQDLLGHFDLKGGEMQEGLACFYNQNKFKLVEKYLINLADEAQKNENMSEICNRIEQNQNLSQRFFDRKTVLQVLELESLEISNKRLLVANTHFYFHPNADHIRLLQGAIAIKYIEELVALKSFQNADFKYSVIICGDFNSSPENGVYQLMISQHIPEDCTDWQSCPEEEVKNLSVSHALNLESSYGCPAYTNYSLLFNGCLDYIFFDKTSLKCLQNVPLPSHDEVTLYKAIPNIVFPSDHLCLISDFQWE